MDELTMVRELLPAKPPPSQQAAATARARMLDQPTRGPAVRLGRPGRRRLWYGLGLPVVAGAATAAVILAGSPVSPARGPSPLPHQGAAHVTLTAREILLKASAGAASHGGLATGQYWRTQSVSMYLRLAGTAAHPYEMAFRYTSDEWYPQAAGQQSWTRQQEAGAAPATADDAAAWRAAGSPQSWIQAVAWAGPGKPVYKKATMAAGAPITITDQLNGKVGVAVGDGTWLTAAQFRAFPADPVALKALMVRLAYQDYSKVAPATMPPLDQVLLREALNLLGDPVSPQVRSAVYKVMAALPGVRSLGAMRDPLGRSGYGIDIGPGEGLTGLGSSVATEEIAFIDPGTGALLATEDRVTAPGRTIRANRPPGSMAGTWMCKQRPGWPTCNLPPYYGPLYQGQVWQYSAIQSQGWTDETPPAAGK